VCLYVHICYSSNHQILIVSNYAYTNIFVINCIYCLMIVKILEHLLVVILCNLFQQMSGFFLLKQLIDTSSSHSGIGKEFVKPCPKAAERHLGRSEILCR